MPPAFKTEITETGRVCTGCKIFKEFATGFSKNGVYGPGSKVGQPKWQSKCKDCQNKTRRERTAAKKTPSAPTTPAAGSAVSQQEMIDLLKKLNLQPTPAPTAAPAPEKKRKSSSTQ